ncbi:MAG: toll/interleukin-1 receptor domain-containing protein [Methanobrevibacter sp.]|nr:toll/interleukin-1 receptor domain-containing protein [Methanobrevibacter sp.]
MEDYSKRFVRPLHEAENEFIQILLSEFTLTRDVEKDVEKITCEVSFNDESPCIWTREGKKHIKDKIKDFDRKVFLHSQELNEFFYSTKNKLEFNDAKFPFRYVSGGTLPVVKLGNKEYFILLYRETFPIGWNLTNGGSDTSAELLNPFAVVEREFREELLILNREKKFRYIFDTKSENPIDMPEHLIAREKWKSKLIDTDWGDISQYETLFMPVKWLNGPDTLKITYNENDLRVVDECYINICGEDFGIEVDRVAKLNLDDHAIFLNGELVDGQLINAPVGLFEVHRMKKLLAEGVTEFIPDFFFYDGEKFEGEDILKKTIVNKFIPYICEILPEWDRTEWENCIRPFNLCPVARGVLERAAKLWEYKNQESSEYKVFISFAEPDKDLAYQVYNHVKGEMKLKTYFSEVSYAKDYSKELDNALDSANCLIAVGSSRKHFLRKWLEYEIRSFHKDIHNELKPDSASIIPFLSNMNPLCCPKPLSFYNGVLLEKKEKEETKKALDRLEKFVSEALNTS